MVTRRQAIIVGLGFPGALAAFSSKEFWNDKKPTGWTEAEIRELLNKSPWAKQASITDTGRTGSLSSAPAAGRSGRRGGRGAVSTGGVPTSGTSTVIKWAATVRWESALPIREALHRDAPGEAGDDYIINVFGAVPGVDLDIGDEILKEDTKLEHKGDSIKPNRIEPAPSASQSEDGTLFYFSRLLALRLSDKEAMFSTKLGPIEVKCKFTLKDMLYRGELAL